MTLSQIPISIGSITAVILFIIGAVLILKKERKKSRNIIFPNLTQLFFYCYFCGNAVSLLADYFLFGQISEEVFLIIVPLFISMLVIWAFFNFIIYLKKK